MLSIALIGCGKLGRLHAETLARHAPGARLAAVVDPVRACAEDAAAQADGAVIAEAPDAVLRNEGIDAVVIASPSAFHAATVIEAARHGKHIFCEKPLALTAEDARRALDAVAAAGVKLQVGFQRRFDAAYARAKQAIDRGEIGTVELVISTTRDPEPNAPGYLESCGGIFLETAIHDFDSIRWLTGSEAVEVYAAASALITTDRHGPYDIDTTAVTLRLASGALATVTNSLRAVYGYEAGAEVFGSRGKLVISPDEGAGVQVYSPAGVAHPYPQNYAERFLAAYRAEITGFVRAIADDTRPAVTGDDGLRAVEIALAATQSQREGRVVKV